MLNPYLDSGVMSVLLEKHSDVLRKVFRNSNMVVNGRVCGQGELRFWSNGSGSCNVIGGILMYTP